MEYKYTSDGKKVVIVGQLNTIETIVQEVFVKEDGSEIPSGESFTTKSLHDEPVESWHSRELEKLKKKIENIKLNIESEKNTLKVLEEKRKAAVGIFKSNSKLVDLFPEGADILISFLTGNIEYLVEDGYDITPPVPMTEAIVKRDYWCGSGRFDSIKLCSVFGNSKGNLEYRIHEYNDGSGCSMGVFPFSNKEDALEHIRKRAIKKIEDNSLTEKDFKACIKMGIEFSPEHEEKHLNKQNALRQKVIREKQDTIDKLKNEISNLEQTTYY